MQKPVQQFVSTCGQARIFVENEMPIGVFHDFLMMIKGLMVERMVLAHKEQEEQAKAAMILPQHDSELPPPELCVPPCEDSNKIEAILDIMAPTPTQE